MDRRSGHTGHGLHFHFINHHLYLGIEKSAPGENDGGYLKRRGRQVVMWRCSGRF